MRPSHPGAFLRDEVIEELGLSTTKAAEILGVRRATLSNLVNERGSLSPEMALRVEKAFGVSMELMLRMQALFDAHAMRMRAGTIEVERFVAERAA
jgi:antitoxin HigA-1